MYLEEIIEEGVEVGTEIARVLHSVHEERRRAKGAKKRKNFFMGWKTDDLRLTIEDEDLERSY